MKKYSLLLLALFSLTLSCIEKPKKTKKQQAESNIQSSEINTITHAKGFQIRKEGDLTVLTVSSPWPESNQTFTYALIDKSKLAFITLDANAYDAIIGVPIEKIVVTSTTHIPILEALGVENTLVGFPDSHYISSKKTRALIDNGLVKELGKNEALNTEVLIDLEPELVVGFSINNNNKAYETIQKSRIPVVYNGDWIEHSPLGKAEWMKFFAAFFQKEHLADSLFSVIEKEYLKAKDIASAFKNKPTVLSGAMYKDIWYLPSGDSWAAKFIEDANAQYLWNDSKGTGSLSLNFESVLDKGQTANFWIGPGQFISYDQMRSTNDHYTRFDAFKTKKVYTYSSVKGETGGLLYYELAPNRPDLVLKDLISIFHPEALPDYKPSFFKPLQ
ncbi:ABC transporter substrate-binding protein [Ascidiimonas sp. W6]|uniref:ABC transporter substrate-binding protein n=1 Tax=Ascidiimonas meishanensis TaxID=3128903 RepID=UPI0030ED9CB2